MQNLLKVCLIGLLFGVSLVQARPPEMKTHSSTVKGAKVTVVHFSAPW